METEKLTTEELQALSSVGIIAKNWYAVTYNENQTPFAMFDNEDYAKAYLEKFCVTAVIVPYPMQIKDYRKQQNQPQPEKVDDVQWQDIMTTAAGIEPEKDSDTSTITGMIKTVIEICKEHAEDGCFDAEGAEANAIRILTRKQTPNP